MEIAAPERVHVFESAYDLELAEHYVYGSSRLGTIKKAALRRQTLTGFSVNKHHAGHTLYEVSDHLGNVRTLVSNKQLPIPSSTKPAANVLEYNDYYPF